MVWCLSPRLVHMHTRPTLLSSHTHTHTYSVAISALQQFLKCSESDEMEERLEQYNAWVLMEKEDTCPHGLLHIAR